MKLPKCKICGKEGHYAYQCFQKPKTIKRKPVVFRDKKVSKGIKVSKTINYKWLNRKALIKALDKEISRICRNCGIIGSYNYCYTCGKRLRIEDLDCGHFISRRYIGTRFDLDNVRPQCKNCNRFLHGNLEIYECKLRKELGNEKVDNLITLSKTRHYSTPELEELLNRLKRLDFTDF